MIKVSVNVEVFFFTTIVSVTDQFWLTSLRVKWMRSAKWIVDLCSILKDDKEMVSEMQGLLKLLRMPKIW